MMATSKISKRYVLCYISLACVLPLVNLQVCRSPLGMENGKIKDSQIKVSSRIRPSNTGVQARLRKNIKPWGAWCPKNDGGSGTVTMFDKYIQIDLLNLTKVTRVATQGREYINGTEFVKEYKISYSQDGRKWVYYPDKDSAKEAKIFQGNRDSSTVVSNYINPAVTVRYIRFHPGYTGTKTVCMRLELYGCVSEENGKVILSYSMPVGQGSKNGKIQFKDTSYTGIISNDFYKGGTGILTDGKFGPVDAKEFKGKGWVGWSRNSTESHYISITFEFSDVRKFKNVTLTVNVDKTRDYAVFDRSKIFFSSVENDFSATSFLQYCPSAAPVDHYNANITLSLCENTAKFVKMLLYFGGRWLLITEISFNSVPAGEDKKQSLQKCSGDILASCSLTRSSTEILSTGSTLTPGCEDCTTAKPGLEAKSSNTPIVVAVVLSLVTLVILLIIVFGILEYKRRHRAPQMSTSVSIPEEKVELRPSDFVVEPSRNSQEEDYETPARSDLEPPYKEVQISPPSVYTKLERNNQGAIGASDDHTYQPLLKQDSDYVIPDDGGTESYEDVKISSPPGYTELDKSKQNESTTNNDDGYQKLLKHDSDYVIPADPGTEPYEEVGGEKTIPGYKELDNTKRELYDNGSYQKLIKENKRTVCDD